MRDWYFNAGIIGFLTTISDKASEPENIKNVYIGDNFIEFDDVVLKNFKEKFIKRVFLLFFKKKAYLKKIENVLTELKEKNIKDPYSKAEKELETGGQYKTFLTSLKLWNIEKTSEKEEIIKNLEDILTKLNEYEEIAIYKDIALADIKTIESFVGLKLKGVSSYNHIDKYIEKISKIEYKKELKPQEICLSCQQRKSTEGFNNSISNLIGFNHDNKNWIWAYKDTKSKVCSVCALIYQCAVISFAYTLKKADKNWLNFFYFPHHNLDVLTLYRSVNEFKTFLNRKNDQPIYAMIKEAVRLIKSKQAKNISRNINFIEMADNPILSSRSCKGYNLYNYNIDEYTAKFLQPYLDNDKSFGYYIINKDYKNIKEELLLLAVKKQIGFSLLNRYCEYYISSAFTTKYNLYIVSEYILSYIRHYKEKAMEKKFEAISKKGFANGKELREKLKKDKKINQMDGVVYRFLNDLKISDRDKFLDKYIRIMMSNKMRISFGQNEMLDTDIFLTFGYSFINGLLYEKYEKADEKSDTKGDNQQ